MAGDDKGAGTGKPRPQVAKKAAAPAKKAAEPTPESIGIEGVIRVGGHIITDDGWTPEHPQDEED